MEPHPCRDCGFVNLTGERFCGECGLDVDGVPGASTARAHSPPPVERAERRQMTVMFCDMVGSTSMSARIDAEDLRDVLTAFQDVCREHIERLGGFIARYMGDGMLVYFGYPTAHEDDAERAIRAALAIVDGVARLEGLVEPPEVRCGIATGPVIVGDLIGKGASEEAAVIGETPNLAARLQGLALPGQVVISDRTRRLTHRVTEVEDLGPHALKGFAEPVPAFRVRRALSRREARLGGSSAQSGADDSLVGRDAEVALLRERWQTARGGEGQVVVIRGAAGSGKSRLIRSLEAGADRSTFHLQCSRHHVGSPLFPWVGELSDAVGIGFGDDEAERLKKLSKWQEKHEHESERMGAFASLLSLSGPWPEPDGTPSEQKTARTEALEHRVRVALERGPVRVIVEDAQWADSTSLELLSMLVGVSRRVPLLIVVSARPVGADGAAAPGGAALVQAEGRWTEAGNVSQVSLGGLPRSSAAQLVRALAGEVSLPVASVERIVERADGVPAYLEALTHAMLVAVEVAEDPSSIEVPETLHDTLMAQLDRLGPDRATVQAASVLGRDFEGTLLASLLERDSESSGRSLERLQRSGFLVATGPGHYRFRQALLRDVAYGSLLNKSKRRLHARAADTLIEDFPEAARADPERLARHLYAAEREREAATWWLEAAARASNQAALDEAISTLEQAQTLLDRSVAADDREGQEARADSRTRLALQLRLHDEVERALQLLDEAIVIATKHGLLAARSGAHFVRGNVYFGMGDADACTKAHRAALADAESAGSPELEVQALGGLGDAYLTRGKLQESADAFGRCVDRAAALGMDATAAANAPMRAWPALWSLEIDQARALAEDGIRRAQSGRPRARAVAHHVMIAVTSQMHDLPEWGRQLESFDEEIGAMGVMGKLLSVANRVVWLAAQGRNDEARERVAQARAYRAGAFRELSAAYLLAGVRDDEYPAVLDRAVGLLASGTADRTLQALHPAIWACALRPDPDGLRRIVRSIAKNPVAQCSFSELWSRVADATAERLESPGSENARARSVALRDEAEALGFHRICTLLDQVRADLDGAAAAS
jgi:class 3 adenylate cyclase/tetratricopeptide (TPR) repeat protein